MLKIFRECQKTLEQCNFLCFFKIKYVKNGWTNKKSDKITLYGRITKIALR